MVEIRESYLSLYHLCLKNRKHSVNVCGKEREREGRGGDHLFVRLPKNS